MPAYGKISLVTAVFHPSDISFALSWAKAAPGWGGWKVLVDQEAAPEAVGIAPPGMEEPIFFVERGTGDVVMTHEPPGTERAEVGHFSNLRTALLALCPLDDATMEEIHLMLERDFPRRRDGRAG